MLGRDPWRGRIKERIDIGRSPMSREAATDKVGRDKSRHWMPAFAGMTRSAFSNALKVLLDLAA
jgi:hypothetical protein